MRLSRAIDLYIDELALRGKAKSTRDGYERLLLDFARLIDPHSERLVDQITDDDCRRFLSRWRDKSPSTLASSVSLLRGFFGFLEEGGHLANGSPAARLKRPRRHKAEDLAVVTVSSEDVARMIGACRNFQELICLGAAGYLGRRRTALANARRSDADLDGGYIRFTDKGGKAITQPIPYEFLAVLREAEQHGVWDGPNDWLIPPRRKATTGTKRRESKVIYETVVKVAERVGVRAHAHALRAAFAVHFLEAKPGRIESLKELMGHTRLETTMVYLRRMNRAQAMEDVRDLSWVGSAVSGLNPVDENMPISRERRIRDSNPCSTDDPLVAPANPIKAKLDELIEDLDARAKARDRTG